MKVTSDDLIFLSGSLMVPRNYDDDDDDDDEDENEDEDEDDEAIFGSTCFKRS